MNHDWSPAHLLNMRKPPNKIKRTPIQNHNLSRHFPTMQQAQTLVLKYVLFALKYTSFTNCENKVRALTVRDFSPTGSETKTVPLRAPMPTWEVRLHRVGGVATEPATHGPARVSPYASWEPCWSVWADGRSEAPPPLRAYNQSGPAMHARTRR